MYTTERNRRTMSDPNTPEFGQQPAQQPPAAPQQPAAPQPPQAAPYQAAPYQAAPAQAGVVPGKTLGIVALILAILMPVIGLILGIVAVVQSKNAGVKNGIGLAAIIVGAVLTVIGVITTIIIIGSLAAFSGGAMEAVEACMNGAETVTIAGQTVFCSDVLSQQ